MGTFQNYMYFNIISFICIKLNLINAHTVYTNKISWWYDGHIGLIFFFCNYCCYSKQFLFHIPLTINAFLECYSKSALIISKFFFRFTYNSMILRRFKLLLIKRNQIWFIFIKNNLKRLSIIDLKLKQNGKKLTNNQRAFRIAF